MSRDFFCIYSPINTIDTINTIDIEQREGGEGALPYFFFSLLSRPRAGLATVCKDFFFGIIPLNVRDDNIFPHKV